jgi:hypothetical protein
LGGQSEAGIRWLNAALGVGAVYLSYALGVRLFCRRAATLGAAFLAVGAPFLVVSRFVYTDVPQIFLMLLNLVLLAPLIVDARMAGDTRVDRGGMTAPLRGDAGREANWRFWAIGLSMAALFNTKYSAYVYAMVVVAFLYVRQRSLFADRRTWLAMGIAACGLLPVLVWNAGHDWVSFRWQFQHFGTGTVFRSSVWANVLHAIAYLTPPLALAGGLAVLQFRGLRRQMLLVPALALTLPILLGPTDSPRNLLTGLALLLVLAGEALDRWIARGRWWAWAAVGVLLLSAVLYGLGTVSETMSPAVLPSSSVARAVRVDGAGWRSVGPSLVGEDEVFALDYSIASQLRYYGGRPVYTAWGQYRLWGIPSICGPDARVGSVQIVALGYVDPQFVTRRLSETFHQVQGPRQMDLGEGKTLYAWTVEGCTVDQETLLERFDLLGLLEAGGGA